MKVGLNTSYEDALELVISHLVYWGGGGKPEFKRGEEGGICYGVELLLKDFTLSVAGRVDATLSKLMSEWEEYSGDPTCPVPHPTESPMKAFTDCGTLWEGEYGATRRRLCLYLAEKLGEML